MNILGEARPAPPGDIAAPIDSPPIDDARWSAALAAVVRDPDLQSLHAQPIAELTSGAIVGYELLSRFRGPWRAAPDVWFAAAERWGYNAALQARTVRAGIAVRSTLPAGTFLTVNVDPHLLVDEQVAGALMQPDLTRVVLELTEHTRAQHDGRTAEVLAHVRSAGGLLAMDDAGTGYAGLSMLLDLRPHIVKLDRRFITGLDTDPVKRALVEVFGDLAGRMDAWILAEGIETKAELDALIGLGVPLGQGWALAHPAAGLPDTLSPTVVDHIRSKTASSSLVDDVMRLVRPARVGGNGSACAVLLDRAGQAAQVRDDRGLWAPAMLVAPSTSIRDATRRAMTRPARHRFAPLVCTDDRGQVLGTITIDDLVTNVVRSEPARIGR